MTTEERNLKSVGIDRLDALGILRIINEQDIGVAEAVQRSLGDIACAVDMAVGTLLGGGRVCYAGAGTSGRMGVVDALECPPTFNCPEEWFQAVVAGGGSILTRASEGAEDNRLEAVRDLERLGFSAQDLLFGIAASGRTPYTLAAIEHAVERGARTVALVGTRDSTIAARAEHVIVVEVGPEVLAGSTRMKAGTAQKMVLSMFSTAVMIRMGMTYDNWMINVQVTNAKLRNRGLRIVESILGIDRSAAQSLIDQSGGALKVAVVMGRWGCDREQAEQELARAGGNLRRALGES